ncbi:MAG: tRNA (guanosine(37)-N1)-methyltransferase TrmD [Burkholderiaceae bacterium]
MRIDAVSIFPDMFSAVADNGITGRARKRGLWQFHAWNPRDFTDDPYRRIDDRPYGGGPGMVMLGEPLQRALAAIIDARDRESCVSGPVICLSPHGEPLKQGALAEMVQLPSITLIAGRYEGIDARFVDRFVDREVSIGDYVLSGGELPAMVLMDAIVRLLPGAMNDPDSSITESFSAGLLDWPHFTRPETYLGESVPPVLMSGNHAQIDRWRRHQALMITARRRPDLIADARRRGLLSVDDERFLADSAGNG